MSRRSARQTSGLRRAAPRSRSAARKRSHHRRLFFEPLEARRLLALLTVGNDTDLVNGDVTSIAALMANPGADGISLREAIEATNATAGADEIQFSPAILTGGTARIFLTAGELAISDSLTIRGLGANRLTIDAGGSDDPTPGVNNSDGHRALRVQGIAGPINVTLDGLSITGGESTFADDLGAGILNFENLTLRAVSIFGNRGHVGGDAGRGGAIANLQGTLFIDSSSIFDNDAAIGGGILNDGAMTIVNSTISGNRAEFVGGGIYHSFSSATISHSTITQNRVNSSDGGSGISSGAGMQVRSSIVAGNIANDDVRGGLVSLGFNLIGSGTGSGAFGPTEVGFFDPALGPLAIQGGTTPVHVLLPASPALDAGNPAALPGIGLVPFFDQRGDGFTRVLDGRIDIGAVEGKVPNSAPVLNNPGDRTTNEGATFSINGMFTFTDADGGGTHTATIDWGDGSDVQSATVNPASGGGSIVGSHVYRNDGTYTLTVRVSDGQGGEDEESIQVNVVNVAPSLIVAASQTAVEGVPLHLTGTPSLGLYVDPGTLDTHTATVNWGDGSPVEAPMITAAPGAGLLSASHTYNNAGTYTVTVRVTDDSNQSDTKTFTVLVMNAPPAIDSLAITASINEGQTATLSGSYSDATTGDTHELDVDWDGDGTFDQTIAVSGGTFSVARLYGDDDPSGTSFDTFNVNVRLRDNNGGSTSGSTQVTVSNVLPELVVAGNQTIDVGAMLDLSTSGAPLGTFTDAGILDTHMATVNWGDNQGDLPVNVSEQGGSGTLAATHVYAVPGTYQVTVTVRDDDGGERAASFQVLVRELPSFVVTTEQDVVANDGLTSLREAIAYANSTIDADTITFAASLSGQRIELKGGELEITRSLSIDAAALSSGLTIDARGNDATPGVADGQGSRIFRIASADFDMQIDVTIAGVTLTGGDVNSIGGAIYNEDNLTLRQVLIFGNSAVRQGGGIANFGSLTIRESTLSGNTAGVTSGGGGPVVNGFISTPRGGAVYSNYGALEVFDSTISGNVAEFGGGIFGLDSDVLISGSTIGQNSATNRGGGMWIENGAQSTTRNVEIRHSTIYLNSANLTGSGLLLAGPLNATISNTLIAGTAPITGAADVSFGTSSTSVEYSLIGSTNGLSANDLQTLSNGAGNLLNQAPLLAALANNGGRTQTYALMPGSPAVNAGLPAAVAGENGVPSLDQRGTGFSRVRGLSIDIGAFEVQNNSPGIAVPFFASTSEGTEFDISTRVLFIDDDATDQHTVEVDWGDGTIDANVPVSDIAGPRFVLGKHTYRDNGSFVVKVTVYDGYNLTFRLFAVDVANADPTAEFGNDGPVKEGSSATVAFSNVFDAGEADRLAGLRFAYDLDNDGAFDVGDGSYAGSVAAASQAVPTELLADGPSTRTIRARVIDKNGGFTDYTTVVEILNADPLADAGGSYNVDEGQKVQLNATAFDVPGDALTFEWDFNDDGEYDDATGANPEFDAAAINGPATILVRLRVTDGDGGVGFDVATINVRNVPPQADAGGPYSVDEGGSVALQAVASDVVGDPLVYEWDFNGDGQYDDAVGATSVFDAANIDGPATIIVGLRVSDGDGGVSFDTAVINVRNVPPRVDSGGPYVVDEGSSVRLEAIASDVPGDTFVFEWDFDNDGLYDNATGASPLFSAANLDGPTTVTVGLRVTDDDGGVSFVTATINVGNVPPRPIPGGPYVVDEGGRVQLQAGGDDVPGDLLTYEWDLDNDGTFEFVGATAIFDANGRDGPDTAIVRLRVSDDDGAQVVVDVPIEIRNVAPGLSFAAGRVDSSGLTVLNGVIDDPGENESYTVLIDWGDGSNDVLQLPPGQKTFLKTHQYATDGGSSLTPGVWPITVMVTDAIAQVERIGEAEDPPEPFIPFFPPPIIPEITTPSVPSGPFNPPATAPESLEQTRSGFELPTSDGGAGGKYLDGADEGYQPPDDSLEAERALQALLSSPRMVRREEIVDAVHELGELELVSLLGFDLGDEPVFVAQKPAPKPQPAVAAPVAEQAVQPLAITTGKPVLPDDSGGISWFWTALGVSGSLWVGGTWWWRRRRRRLLAQSASFASRKTISEI